MTFSIEVKTRKETAENTRVQGLIPAILYGAGAKSVSVSVNGLVFNKLYNEAGESNLIDLSVDGGSEKTKVLIKDAQRDPVRDNFIHVDFMKINMNKEMHATLPVRFVGESPAVKELGGTLIKALEEVHIKCLPKDLVSELSFDLSVLNTFSDIIHVRDLKLPAGIVVTENPTTVVVKVAAPLTEEQLKAMEEAGPKGVEDVEVEKKKKEALEGEEVEAEKGAEPKKPSSAKAPAGKEEKPVAKQAK